ncbi:hypothetical protein M3A78_007775 [Micrococcus luteus]|nr:hypothetical protein [Micrococcus luteus]
MVSLSAPRSTGPLVLRLASSPRPALVQEPGAPDEPGAVDQRIELSGRVTVNWAAKFAGLLGAEGIGAGDAVALDLPVHWLSHALALGVLCAEAEPALEGDSPAAVLTDRPEAWPDPSAAVFAVALPRGLDPEFDGPAADPAVVDVAAEIRAQPDALPGPVDHVRPASIPAGVDVAPDDDGPRPRLTWAGVRAALEAWDAGRAVTVHP